MDQSTDSNAEAAGAATPHVWILPAERGSVAELRRGLQTLLVFLPPALVDDVVLTASEVVANAVLHGKEPITVWVWPGDQVVRVEVTDSGSGTLQLRRTSDGQDEGGRGLVIVDAIADRWGVLPSEPGPGKTVWFEIDSVVGATASPSL